MFECYGYKQRYWPSASDSDETVQLPRSRKRSRNVAAWKSSKRKQRRNSGQEYTSSSDTQVCKTIANSIGFLVWITLCTLQVPARVVSTVSCKCGLRCFDVLSQEQRQRIFDHFWKLESFDVQNGYLCGAVKALAGKRWYTKRTQSRRNTTQVYYVHDGRVSVHVCEIAFLRIHGISNGRLSGVLKNAEGRGRNTQKR